MTIPPRSAYHGDFNPRPPHGGRPDYRGLAPVHVAAAGISTRAPRTEGDPLTFTSHPHPYLISTRAPRTEGDTSAPVRCADRDRISTRAPRTEGDEDRRPVGASSSDTDFNPRPPHGGRLVRRETARSGDIRFQPAPPARRATGSRGSRPLEPTSYFNPRPPHGGRPSWMPVMVISTRAPRTEGDTEARDGRRDTLLISTRAPRTEGDEVRLNWWGSAHVADISTRAPRTEGDRRGLGPPPGTMNISTRAPRTEGDVRIGPESNPAEGDSFRRYHNFNPRPPHGGRPDFALRRWTPRPHRFQPAPPARRATNSP